MKKAIILLISLLIVVNSAPALNVLAYDGEEDFGGENYSPVQENKMGDYSVAGYAAPYGFGIPEELNLVAGEEALLPDENLPEGIQLTFGSDNPSVVCVNSNGVVKALSAGEATIICQCSTGDQLSCFVTVAPEELESLSFDKSSATLIVNQTLSLELKPSPSRAVYSGEYSSDNNSVATVDKNGRITAVKKGTANISFIAENGVSAKCKVTVNNTSKSLSLASSSATLTYDSSIKKGTTCRVKINQSASSFYGISYSSSNTKVATVSSNGTVQPCSAGTAKIYVNADGATATFTVTVIATNNKDKSLNEVANRAALNYSSTTRYVYGKTVQDRELEAYIIKGSNSRSDKILFADFACHGFEDSYYRDGQVLVALGNTLVEYYAKNPKYLGDYTLVVVPCANPDGTIAGENNDRANSNAFGRCTADHIDINRDFGKFAGVESIALRNLLGRYNPDVYLNFHGWPNTSIGTDWLASLSSKTLGLSGVQKNQFATGFIISFVKNTYGAASCLVEYKTPDSAKASGNVTINFIYDITCADYNAKLTNKGWVQTGNVWSYYNSGSRATYWQKINGKWYYFDSKGNMKTGWLKSKNGKWYYLNSDGSMATGWVKDKGKWYYLYSNGIMRTGWAKLKNKWYYLNSDGSMATGWAQVKNKWYYFSPNGGNMEVGWLLYNDNWYFLNSPNGDMVTGWIAYKNNYYYLNAPNGNMAVGTVDVDGVRYVLDQNGARIDGIALESAAVDFTDAVKTNGCGISFEWNKPEAEISGYQLMWADDDSFKENVFSQNIFSSETINASLLLDSMRSSESGHISNMMTEERSSLIGLNPAQSAPFMIEYSQLCRRKIRTKMPKFVKHCVSGGSDSSCSA